MSEIDVLQLYYSRFQRLPERPTQLMSFSRQTHDVPTLKWIEARRVLAQKWSPRKSLQKHRKSIKHNHKPSISFSKTNPNSSSITLSLRRDNSNTHQMHPFPGMHGTLPLQQNNSSVSETESDRFEDIITPQRSVSLSYMSNELNEISTVAVNKYYNNQLLLSTTNSSTFDSTGHSLLAQNQNSNSENDSDCPIYHMRGNDKVLFLHDFSSNYTDLRNEYLCKMNKIKKDRQIQFTEAKQKITDCFQEISVLLKERENALLCELNEIHKSENVLWNEMDMSESKCNNELHKHMTDTKDHNTKVEYFTSVYDGLKHKLHSLNDNETQMDFIVNKQVHMDCCNFLHELGTVISNVPKPMINYVQILGNNVLCMQLTPNNNNTFEIVSYEISYCHSMDEKQERMEWQTISIDSYSENNPYLIEFEIHNLNLLINVDLMFKLRFLLTNEQCSEMWTAYSDIYQMSAAIPLTPHIEHDIEDCFSNKTVCYHQEYEDNECSSVTEQSQCSTFEYEIDIVRFKKDVCFDENELETEMVQSQQLMQQFMKGMDKARQINDELISSIHAFQHKKVLWNDNMNAINGLKKPKKLSFLNGLRRNSSSSLQSMSASLIEVSNKPKKRLSLTGQIGSIANKISHKLLNTHEQHSIDEFDIGIYAELCHILQENPAYLSRITHLIQEKDISLYCQTVVCDLFGNENDSRMEHLLLRLFDCILQQYCAEQNNVQLLFEGDSIISRMISYFMNERCEENTKRLTQIFKRPMKELIFDTEKELNHLNLETDLLKVYHESLDDSVTCGTQYLKIDHRKSQQTNTSYTTEISNSHSLNVESLNSDSLHIPQYSNLNITEQINRDIAQENEAVMHVINERIEKIMDIVGFLLDKMVQNISVVSFGIRWICKMISNQTKQMFPNASEMELNAVIGKIVYLRYFEQALIAPFAFLNINTNDKNNEHIILKNLNIICQVLRSVLCNEKCMIDNDGLLQWITTQQMETAKIFYDRLLDLSDTELWDRLSVDKYLIRCKMDLELSMEQIYLLHNEVCKHQNIWNHEYNHNIPLFDVLDRFKCEPSMHLVNDSSNQLITLDLTAIETSFNPFFAMGDMDNEAQLLSNEKLLQNDESYTYNILFAIRCKDNDDIMGIRHSLKQLLTNKTLPKHIMFKYRYCLKEFLEALNTWACRNNEFDIISLIDSILDRMNTSMLQTGVCCNSFVYDYHKDIKTIIGLRKRLQLKAVRFAKARDTMIDHTSYLENKLLQYEQFIFSPFTVENKWKRDKNLPNAIGITYKYMDMTKQNVIIRTNNKSNNDTVLFVFAYQFGSDCFQMKIMSKNDRKNAQIFTISLMNLLTMRDAKHTQFVWQSFKFSVNETINLLNDILANKI